MYIINIYIFVFYLFTIFFIHAFPRGIPRFLRAFFSNHIPIVFSDTEKRFVFVHVFPSAPRVSTAYTTIHTNTMSNTTPTKLNETQPVSPATETTTATETETVGVTTTTSTDAVQTSTDPVPDRPLNVGERVKVSDITATTAYLAWSPSPSTANVTYTVTTVCPGRLYNSEEVSKAGLTIPEYTVTGLQENTTYQFYVTEKNLEGEVIATTSPTPSITTLTIAADYARLQDKTAEQKAKLTKARQELLLLNKTYKASQANLNKANDKAEALLTARLKLERAISRVNAAQDKAEAEAVVAARSKEMREVIALRNTVSRLKREVARQTRLVDLTRTRAEQKELQYRRKLDKTQASLIRVQQRAEKPSRQALLRAREAAELLADRKNDALRIKLQAARANNLRLKSLVDSNLRLHIQLVRHLAGKKTLALTDRAVTQTNNKKKKAGKKNQHQQQQSEDKELALLTKQCEEQGKMIQALRAQLHSDSDLFVSHLSKREGLEDAVCQGLVKMGATLTNPSKKGVKQAHKKLWEGLEERIPEAFRTMNAPALLVEMYRLESALGEIQATEAVHDNRVVAALERLRPQVKELVRGTIRRDKAIHLLRQHIDKVDRDNEDLLQENEELIQHLECMHTTLNEVTGCTFGDSGAGDETTDDGVEQVVNTARLVVEGHAIPYGGGAVSTEGHPAPYSSNHAVYHNYQSAPRTMVHSGECRNLLGHVVPPTQTKLVFYSSSEEEEEDDDAAVAPYDETTMAGNIDGDIEAGVYDTTDTVNAYGYDEEYSLEFEEDEEL